MKWAKYTVVGLAFIALVLGVGFYDWRAACICGGAIVLADFYTHRG